MTCQLYFVVRFLIKWRMKKVLIVDDLETFVREEAGILNRANLQVFTARSAREALEVHGRELVDLILADLNMPEMNGDEMVKVIRTDPKLKNVSILMVTSLKKADMQRCADCGANDYITRPVEPRKLVEKISTLLEIPQRKSLRVLVKVTVRGKFDTAPFFGSTQNVSSSGLLLETDKTLAKGDVISCSFFLPDSERVNCEGEVARCILDHKMNEYGIRFFNLAPEAKQSIEKFVAKSNRPA